MSIPLEDVKVAKDMPTPAPCSPLEGPAQRLAVLGRILWLRFREYLEFDSKIVSLIIRCAACAIGHALMRLGSPVKGFALLSSLHRSGRLRFANGWLERQLMSDQERGTSGGLATVLDHAIETSDALAPASLRASPANVFPNVAIVLRSPSEDRKGVLNLSYSYVYPWFHRHFDVGSISERYHIVLEPSWSGFCSADLLTFTQVKAPVFVQAVEPYDSSFLSRLKCNLVPIPIAANWWTDEDLFGPANTSDRTYDFIMVAGWADFKRHHRVFQSIARLADRGYSLRGACVGYPQGRSLKDIQELASYYNVDRQLEFFDRVSPSEVAQLFARSSVCVLWSRREGFNRAVVESLFANVPVLMRHGFNYGFEHDYINEQTGKYVKECQLGETLLRIVDASDSMNPRAWVRDKMNPRVACRILEDAICREVGESRNEECSLTPKRNTLNRMEYLDPLASVRFQEDYRWLRGKTL